MNNDPLQAAAWEKLERLVEKFNHTEDADLREGLSLTIRDLVQSLKAQSASPPSWVNDVAYLRELFPAPVVAVDSAPTAPAELPEPETSAGPPEEPIQTSPPLDEAEQARRVDEAESLLRQARLATSRGNKQQAFELLFQAAQLAPNSSTVLEALGDELLLQRKNKEAKEMFDKARKADPSNISADRKYAEMIFSTVETLTAFERSSDIEVVATSKAAAILSLFMPGLGQLVQTDWVKGSVYLAIGITCWAVALLNGLLNMFAAVGLRQGMPDVSPLAFAGLIGALITHIVSSVDAGSKGKIYSKKEINRPKPPVDLPFD